MWRETIFKWTYETFLGRFLVHSPLGIRLQDVVRGCKQFKWVLALPFSTPIEKEHRVFFPVFLFLLGSSNLDLYEANLSGTLHIKLKEG
jgi:hypothetical protein